VNFCRFSEEKKAKDQDKVNLYFELNQFDFFLLFAIFDFRRRRYKDKENFDLCIESI